MDLKTKVNTQNQSKQPLKVLQITFMVLGPNFFLKVTQHWEQSEEKPYAFSLLNFQLDRLPERLVS